MEGWVQEQGAHQTGDIQTSQPLLLTGRVPIIGKPGDSRGGGAEQNKEKGGEICEGFKMRKRRGLENSGERKKDIKRSREEREIDRGGE